MSSFSPFTKEQLMPQPEMLEIKKQKGELFIGLPKETHFEEKRISLSPDAVSALIAHGHRIVVETGAGDGANYSDKEYSDAGAKISYDIKEAFACNIVLKVEPPSLDEIKMINPQTVLISALQLKTQDKKYFEGNFDIDNLENFTTQGISLFMILPIEGEPHQVFNMMHNAARKIAEEFSAQIYDGGRSLLTKQSLQQYVENIREFERQRLINS